MPKKKIKTLITGATGFIGSAVLRELIKAGHAVRALVRPDSDRRNLAGLSVEIVKGDLTKPDSLKSALKGCQALFHVAADYRLWTRNPKAMFETNVIGTRNLMLAAGRARVKRIVYTSSVSTLGLHSNGVPSNETTPVSYADMIGPYKRSKFLAEEEVKKLVAEKKLPVVIVNPSAPVGPRDIKPTPTGRMIVEAASGRMPVYVDTGLNIVHVDDVARGHLLAFKHGKIGKRYILGGQNMTLKKILGKIASITGHRPPMFRLFPNFLLPLAYLSEAWTRLTGGDEPLIIVDGVKLARKYMFFSVNRAKKELGYKPRPADKALHDAIDWFKKNGYLE